jgi:hypothetical protein
MYWCNRVKAVVEYSDSREVMTDPALLKGAWLSSDQGHLMRQSEACFEHSLWNGVRGEKKPCSLSSFLQLFLFVEKNNG